ncbi:unnamed protein product [Strongylus vulgaris]|uniref:Uncharacterized protein n=1 Tax=Strongylus vulgaris TaxID=40348 RepID=A0A3P7JE22_STRVU|nr:unnamed protein product [Strongylus vulgaris]
MIFSQSLSYNNSRTLANPVNSPAVARALRQYVRAPVRPAVPLHAANHHPSAVLASKLAKLHVAHPTATANSLALLLVEIKTTSRSSSSRVARTTATTNATNNALPPAQLLCALRRVNLLVLPPALLNVHQLACPRAHHRAPNSNLSQSLSSCHRAIAARARANLNAARLAQLLSANSRVTINANRLATTTSNRCPANRPPHLAVDAQPATLNAVDHAVADAKIQAMKEEITIRILVSVQSISCKFGA